MLISLAEHIAVEGDCAQKRDIADLQRRAIVLVNNSHVPVELQKPLLKGVASLVADAPACVPPVRTARPPTTTAAKPPAQPTHVKPPGHEHKHGHGHGHGNDR